MLFYDNLEEIIFNRHKNIRSDELIVLSGYVGPQPVQRLKQLSELNQIKVVYGMYGESGIGRHLHEVLISANNDINNLDIMYSQIPVHSKCYIWKFRNNIQNVLVGSANFSSNGLSNPYREILAETTSDTFDPLNAYLNKILENSIPCNSELVHIGTTPTEEENIIDTSIDSQPTDLNTCNMSLLDEKGEVPRKSGLNWGLSNGHVAPGDAYIRISKKYIERSPNLFPPKQIEGVNIPRGARAIRQNEVVEFIWDDGKVMEGLLEQNQVVNGVIYPKAMCSSPRKNILGKYLRSRLGLQLDHLITKEDLDSYGRNYITLTKQGEGIYYLDFSVPDR